MTDPEPTPNTESDEELTADEIWALNNPAPGSGLPGSPENPFPPPPPFE